jgi:hypothetical protein
MELAEVIGETDTAAITDTLEQLGYETVADDNVA